MPNSWEEAEPYTEVHYRTAKADNFGIEEVEIEQGVCQAYEGNIGVYKEEG